MRRQVSALLPRSRSPCPSIGLTKSTSRRNSQFGRPHTAAAMRYRHRRRQGRRRGWDICVHPVSHGPGIYKRADQSWLDPSVARVTVGGGPIGLKPTARPSRHGGMPLPSLMPWQQTGVVTCARAVSGGATQLVQGPRRGVCGSSCSARSSRRDTVISAPADGQYEPSGRASSPNQRGTPSGQLCRLETGPSSRTTMKAGNIPRIGAPADHMSTQWTPHGGLLVAVRLLRVPGLTLAALVADAAVSAEAGCAVGPPTALPRRVGRRQGLDRGRLGGRLLPRRSGSTGGRGSGLQGGVPGLAHGSLGVHLAHAPQRSGRPSVPRGPAPRAASAHGMIMTDDGPTSPQSGRRTQAP
jgi:hypothetical protein